MENRVAVSILRITAWALLVGSCGGRVSESSAIDDSTAVGGKANTTGTNAPKILITAGGLHTCAVIDGRSYCWGYNIYGQLGDGTTNRALVPVAVVGLTADVSAITAGGDHTCALTKDIAYCWGYNRRGQLGIGSRLAQSQVPVAVSVTSLPVTALSAGDEGTCALTNGTAWCWGSSGLAETPAPAMEMALGVTAISVGSVHGCAITNGAAVCWGKDADLGLLGDGAGRDSAAPVQVLGAASGVTAISAGDYFSCAVVSGHAWCWGSKRYGRLGGSGIDSAPDFVRGLPDGVTTIGVGEAHACALVDGGVWCWGYNASGQLGNGDNRDSSIPVQVDGLSAGVTGLAVGSNHSCALVGSEIRCWGWNGNGQLGIGSLVDSTVPVTVTLR